MGTGELIVREVKSKTSMDCLLTESRPRFPISIVTLTVKTSFNEEIDKQLKEIVSPFMTMNCRLEIKYDPELNLSKYQLWTKPL